MNTENIIKIIQLIRTQRIGSITFHQLMKQYGSLDNILAALPYLVKNYSGNFKLYSKSKAQKEYDIAEKNNIKIISCYSEAYPPLLKHVEDHPPILFVKGNSNLLKKTSVAIVGSRNASLNGRQTAEFFAESLGKNKIAVVSGMAKGIDASAHKGSINTGTIAFLGGGVDIIYPKQNESLYNEIVEKGALISEYPINSKPYPYNFPKRNRLIAGMTRGVLIVEANISSGSMITANFAAELGREVFAIPNNPSDPRSAGCNYLLKNGALLTETPQDILNSIKPLTIKELNVNNTYNSEFIKPTEMTFINQNEITSYVYNLLSTTPINIDDIIKENTYPANKIQASILELELCGKLERLPGNLVSILSKS